MGPCKGRSGPLLRFEASWFCREVTCDGTSASGCGSRGIAFAFPQWGCNQEPVADLLGRLHMARADCDPRPAMEFWQRMSQCTAREASCESLSAQPRRSN